MKISYVLMLSLILVACSKDEAATKDKIPVAKNNPGKINGDLKTSHNSAKVPLSQSEFSMATIAKGGKVYKENCAACHGANGEGAAEWRKRKANGKLKPPPLNGTGHTWHHSKALLLSIIANGTASQGGEMPAWRDKLSKDEMEAALIWVQSKWPKETYQAWLEINNR